MSRGHPKHGPHRLLIHDRDAIFSADLDRSLTALGLRVLKTPVRSPQANAYCERFIGTLRRECLDWLLPRHEDHVRRLLQEWVLHYNRGRPHRSLGPGIPEPRRPPPALSGHQLPPGMRVVVTPILGGLHHEYRLERVAA